MLISSIFLYVALSLSLSRSHPLHRRGMQQLYILYHRMLPEP